MEVNDKGVQLAHVGEVGHEIPNLWSVGGQWTMVISLHFLDLVFLGSFLRLVWWLHLSRSCVWNRDPVFPSPHHLQKKKQFLWPPICYGSKSKTSLNDISTKAHAEL